MNALGEFFLTGLAAYGAPLFAAALFLGASGVPIPTSFLVVAAGAFVRQDLLDADLAAAFGLVGAVSGDSVSFALGRWGGAAASRRIGTTPAWLRIKSVFERNASLAVFLTRFLITPAALPVNLLAGASCGYLRFVGTSLLGQSVWLAVYGGLGFLFGSQWELVGQFLSEIGGFTLGIAILGIGGVYFLRVHRRR